MPFLRYTSQQGQVEHLELAKPEVIIGRLSKCDIVLTRPTVSRRHARVYRTGNHWYIADLGSSHGTLVNEQPATDRALVDGDAIRIGSAAVTYLERQDGAPGPSVQPVPRSLNLGLGSDSGESSPLRDLATEDSRDDIVAEQALDHGRLMQTMAQARRLDVTRIIENPHALMADLEAQAGPAAAPREVTQPKIPRAGTPAQGSDVASHLLTLVRISDELRRATDAEAVCRTSVDMLLSATRASRGVIALSTPDGTFVPVVQRTREGEANVRVSQTFVDRVVRKRVGLVALDTGQDQALSMARSVVAFNIQSILCAPLWDGEDILGYLYLDSTGVHRTFGPSDLDFAVAVGHQAAAEIKRLRLVEQIREEQERRRNLGRFLSADVITHIEEEAKAGRLDPTLSASEQVVTILFSDIKGFTSLSERMAPAEVKKLLDDYFGRMTEIIVDRYKGTLDKYIGDAIMALFGAPYSSGTENDARNAVAAAVAMRDTVDKLRKERDEYAQVQIRLGINTGRVVAGTMGSQRRLEYSVLGDAVNVASRLESTGEAGAIQIGESTYEKVRDVFDCRFSGERKVKNRAQTVAAWWVIGPKK
ncbi:MAG: adenylate/guanylate cyclase domain-containing protein [Pseudomonadota bacterium]